MSSLPLVRLWIWISAFASLAGWALSALGQLNRAGYAVGFVAAAIVFLLWRWRKHSAPNLQPQTSHETARTENVGHEALPAKCRRFLKKSLRRFRRPLPLGFAALAVLIFLGGVIYPSGNYTGMTYRLPRVLQWLAHGHWVWIHTPDYRMNDRACGIEWMSAPLLLFTRSLRGLFLLNYLPFLLLPGLIFSVFTRLGVRARVAWHWMWLLPTGYNFILQAGGTANDTFPTVYALAAVGFALRAKESKNISDVWLSGLAAALMTGAKASNLPLLLPWAVSIFPSLALLRKKRAATALVVLAAAGVSFLPNAILNMRHAGDWTGAKLEPPVMMAGNPAAGLAGNAWQLLTQNFCPPLFPWAGEWNRRAPEMVPRALAAVSDKFNNGIFHLGELPTEDWAGIGFGLSILLTISVVAGLLHSRSRAGLALRFSPFVLVLVAPWISLLFYCGASGMDTAARLIAPYYPLLLPLLLVGAAQSQIVRQRWWRALAGGVMVLAFVVLALSPDRPLWPAKTLLSRLAAQHPNSHLLSRAREVYAVYALRADPLAGVRALLPPNLETVGFIGDPDDCEISLWQPLGRRCVKDFFLTDPPEQIRAQVQYAVVGGFNLKSSGVTLDECLRKWNAKLVATTHATLKVSEGPQPWYVVRFKR